MLATWEFVDDPLTVANGLLLAQIVPLPFETPQFLVFVAQIA